MSIHRPLLKPHYDNNWDTIRIRFGPSSVRYSVTCKHATVAEGDIDPTAAIGIYAMVSPCEELMISTRIQWKKSSYSGTQWRTSECFSVDGVERGWIDGLLDEIVWTIPPIPREVQPANEETCDQPGCLAPAIIKRRLLRLYSRDGDWVEAAGPNGEKLYHQFCEEHQKRGTCALEDNDINYDPLDGPPGPPIVERRIYAHEGGPYVTVRERSWVPLSDIVQDP